MKKNELEFGMENGMFTITTNQVLDSEVFKNKIANLETQKVNFEMQEDFYGKEIERLEKSIEDTKKTIEANRNNIKLVSEDLEKAYHFLEKNHQAPLIEAIKAEVEKRRKEMEEQMKNQSGQ